MSVSVEPRRPRAAGRRGSRRLGPAREDLAAAVLLVLALVVSGTVGPALQGVAGAVVLGARGSLSLVAVGWRRVTGRGRVAASPRPDRSRRRRGPSPQRRAVRILTMGALVALAVAAVSYGQAMSARSNSSLAIRTVEWMRDAGAAGVVSAAESFFYTLTAPAKGGPALKRLPVTGVAAGGGNATQSGRVPDVAAVIHPRLPGEGVWRPTQKGFTAQSAPMLVTTYRPDPSYPRVVAGLARIDPHRALIGLYPGLQEPPGAGPRGSASVPVATRARLLAVFNSGFKHGDSHGGFFAGGHLFEPLRPGQGTIVGTADGRVDVRAWSGGSTPGPGVAFARQNLPLIVDGGLPNPTLGNDSKWGTTVGNAVLVWRSGVGVDRAGNVIYAAANYQSAKGLARILIHAGAVRAIELDINSYWVSFNAFALPGARGPAKLLPDIGRPATRYLSPDDRDFFAVYRR